MHSSRIFRARRGGWPRVAKHFATRFVRLVASALAISTLGCSALDVNAPTTIRIPDVENPGNAVLAVNGIRQFLVYPLQDAISVTGSLADEFGVGNFDRSVNFRKDIWVKHSLYGKWQEAYYRATTAISITQHAGTVARPYAGEALALRGYAMLSLGEEICPGFPVIQLHIDGEAITPIYTSDPQTTDSAFTRALADFDSALVYAGDSVRIRHLAQIGRARALLGLGRFTEAGAAVSGVPTAYQDSLVSAFSLFSNFAFFGYPVQDREGTNGLDFVSSHDPRVVLVNRNGDGTTFTPEKFVRNNNQFPPMMLANGVEARLIQAEAALHDDPDNGAWLDTLNVLRQTVALSDTTDPGTPEARVNLLFRERAFWLFGTAHRLGDLRRLVMRYGRDTESVFPTGADYGTWTTIPFDGDAEHVFNPKITGCTSH